MDNNDGTIGPDPIKRYAETNPGWISVEERFPSDEEGTVMVAFLDDEGGKCAFATAYFDHRERVWICDNGAAKRRDIRLWKPGMIPGNKTAR